MKAISHILVCCLVVAHLQIQKVDAFIIPDEIPTLLSLIYSNIPTLKKGTDSRIGWGFRLGDRADFQVLVELGPQKETAPLANQGDNANKRQAAHSLSNQLYAQALRNKQQKQQQQDTEQISDSSGGKFLKQWSDNLKQEKATTTTTTTTEEPMKFTLGIGEVDAKDYIPPDDINVVKTPMEALESLYKKEKSSTTTFKPKTTTSYKDALDNVDLD